MRRALLAGVLAVAGCVVHAPAVYGDRVLTGPVRPPFPGQVRIVMDGAPVPPDAEELGIVTASGQLQVATLPAVIGVLQSQAASLGANAVVRVRYDVGPATATATGVAVWLR